MLETVHFRWFTRFGRAAACVVLGLCLIAPSLPLRAAQPELKDLKEAQRRSVVVAERIRAATVGIINPSIGAGMGEGSGVVVSEDGLILTVGHVMGKNKGDLTVVFPDGRRASAKPLGAEFARDAGMAKITDPGKWPHVEMGRMEDVKVGQWCIAVGHPGGIQLNRMPPLRLGRILGLPGKDSPVPFVLSDATVISGDSGGPLFDLDGKVIAIHSNIGMGITENRHVPISVYRDKWQDLIAGKQTGEPLGNHVSGGPGFGGPMPDVQKFMRLLHEQAAAGDPEAQAMLKGGGITATPEQVAALIEKWEKKSKTQAAASGTIDVLKFQRLLQERLVAGDPEVRGLIKDGGMPLSMTQMQSLLQKWDPASAKTAAAQQPAKTAKAEPEAKPSPLPMTPPANVMGDLQKFQKLFMERLQAGDPEVLGMARGGHVVVTPEMMRGLIDKWERKSGGEKSPEKSGTEKKSAAATAKPNAIGPNGQPVPPENGKEMMDLMKCLGMTPPPGLFGDPKAGKANPELLGVLKPVATGASKSTVTVLCEGKPALLGTVVRKNGYIVTKASDLHGKITCKIGDRELPATIVKQRDDYDLALLKVKAKDLTPVAWSKTDLPLGSWLVTADSTGKPLGVGVVGIPSRTIPKSPTMLLRNKAILGAVLNRETAQALIDAVAPAGPADKAGLKKGDIITSVDGKPVANSAELVKLLAKRKPGDKISAEVKRGDKTMKVSVELADSEKMPGPSDPMGAEKLSAMSSASSTLSKRKSDFPAALTHDIVLQAEQCGGPVLDLEGHAVGLNIARVDRTATYAIPASAVKSVISDLMPKSKLAAAKK